MNGAIIKDYQEIYDNFHHDRRGFSELSMNVGKALRYLKIKSQHREDPFAFNDLFYEILLLRNKNLPTIFFERYCISKIANLILKNYPNLHIGEAYCIAYVALNGIVSDHVVQSKLESSGLIYDAVIDNRIFSIPEIAKKMLSSLFEKKLLKLTDTGQIMLHADLKVRYDK